jgi:lysophospholipase L1-like esterase
MYVAIVSLLCVDVREYVSRSLEFYVRRLQPSNRFAPGSRHPTGPAVRCRFGDTPARPCGTLLADLPRTGRCGNSNDARWTIRSRTHDWALNLIVLFATAAAACGAAEAVLRWKHARDIRRIAAAHDIEKLCTTRSSDPRLIYTMAPGRCGANSHGYIDHEYAFTKERGVFRIVVIGDSVAQGRFLSLEESFPKVLEKRLNEDADSLRYEVIVLARLGYSTSQELVLLEEEALRYDPDLILWSYVLNDPAHPVYHNCNGELGTYYYRPRSYLVHLVAARWFALGERWKGRGCEKEFHAYLHCVYWNEAASHLQEIGSVCRRKHVPVAFAIHPIFQKVEDYSGYTLRPLHKKLSQAAAGNGFTVIDLLKAFEPYKTDELRIERPDWYDPWHPNARGHEIVAEFIERALVGKGLIGSGRSTRPGGAPQEEPPPNRDLH